MSNQNEIDVWDEAFAMYLEEQWTPTNLRHTLLLQTAAELIPDGVESVLDVGCGFGDLYPLIKLKGINQYHGVDSSLPMLQRARKRYPDVPFTLGNAFNLAAYDQYDCVVAVSLLVHLWNPTGAIKAMWNQTKQVLIANFTRSPSPERHRTKRGLKGELIHQLPLYAIETCLTNLPHRSQWETKRLGDLIYYFRAWKQCD